MVAAASIRSAVREQGLTSLCAELRASVPELRDQYTARLDDAEYARYWEVKMRGLHAWQVRATLDALEHIGGDQLVIADIGDSSGNHARYIKALAPAGRVARIVSINIDSVAVDKVRSKGGEAIQCRAEELDLNGIRPNLLICFETLEHLTDPVRFLHNLAASAHGEYLLVTVPYRRRSRFGGSLIRLPTSMMAEKLTPEVVHVHELSPEDWLVLARFAGYAPVHARRYLQYPRRSVFRLMQPVLRMLDFEGFFGVLLRRDLSVAERYTGW